tara:strand:+ start:1608 stop:2240 length:633 start_codon:yes stop_codon:yes gene_type:complete
MSSNLDEFLSNTNWSKINNNKKLLAILREAYTCGVPAMIAKSLTDRLKDAGKYEFYLGTPPKELRTIASFLITYFNEKPTIILKLLPALWKRHGREDAILYGIILANINPNLLSKNIWLFFANSLRLQEPADDMLSVCEELARAKHNFPEKNVLEMLCKKGIIYHQLVLFILFQKFRIENKILDYEYQMIESCPGENDIINRLKKRIRNN